MLKPGKLYLVTELFFENSMRNPLIYDSNGSTYSLRKDDILLYLEEVQAILNKTNIGFMCAFLHKGKKVFINQHRAKIGLMEIGA